MKHLLQKKILNKIIKTLSKHDFVIGIVLYGSYAREDFWAKSDIDLFILITDTEYLNKTSDIFAEIRTNRPLQPVIRSINELSKTDITLLKNIFTEGKVLYWKSTYDIQVSNILNLRPYIIFNFHLSDKKQNSKAQFDYALYGKNNKGLLSECEGKKLSKSCVILPYHNMKKISKLFHKYKVKHEGIPVWK